MFVRGKHALIFKSHDPPAVYISWQGRDTRQPYHLGAQMAADDPRVSYGCDSAQEIAVAKLKGRGLIVYPFAK